MNQESKSAVKPITPPQSIPVFNCRVIVSPGETPGSFTATAAELAGLTVSAVSMREAMQKLVPLFKARVAACVASGEEIPWIKPGRSVSPGEQEFFVAVHL